MLSIVDGQAVPNGEHWYKDSAGQVAHRTSCGAFDLQRLTAVDFPYVETIFPQLPAYLGGTIGVHTKRGCPFQCHFCLYNQIEGHRQRYRDPAEVAREVEMLNKRYGVRKIWFTDAQFCSTRRSTNHVEQILDEMLARRIDVTWYGYLRLNHLSPELARKLWISGMGSVDLSFTGSQEMVDSLTLGYKLEQQMDAFRMLKANGHTTQKIKLYLPLNAPGESVQTLRMTIDRIEELYALFGRDNVLPFIFFIGVQPGTPVEQLLIRRGYLKPNYDPLTWNPFLLKRLLTTRSRSAPSSRARTCGRRRSPDRAMSMSGVPPWIFWRANSARPRLRCRPAPPRPSPPWRPAEQTLLPLPLWAGLSHLARHAQPRGDSGAGVSRSEARFFNTEKAVEDHGGHRSR